MRSITTTSGMVIPLEGHLLDQKITEDERRTYLGESLFLDTVTYENERLGVFPRKLTDRA